MLDSRFDEDWIRVELVAGKSYDIRLQGVGLDAAADTVLKIFNSEGEEIAFNDDIETESLNLFSMVEFSPDATGAYYISASGEDIASYRYSDGGVEVRLDDGTARGGDAEGDTFAGRKTIEYVQGGEKAQDSGVPAIEELIISFIFGESVEEAEEIEIPDIEDLFGSAHDDKLVGTYGSNWLKGYYGNDVLDGKEGNDGLFGGGGADALIGGAGNDTAMYLFSDEGVEVRLHNGTARGGEAEGDTFAGTDVIEYSDSEGNTLTREVPDIEHLQGSTRADILAGDLRDNRINGDAGDDVLYDGPDGGDDLLAGGTGDDRLYGGKGNDTLEGGHGNGLNLYKETVCALNSLGSE